LNFKELKLSAVKAGRVPAKCWQNVILQAECRQNATRMPTGRWHFYINLTSVEINLSPAQFNIN
jgi:hypothetical protein